MNSTDIVKDASCMDDYDPKSISVDLAIKNINATLKPVNESELVPVRDALNRVLATDISSNINVPSGINSAMDGYAICADDLPVSGTNKLTVVGTSWAGKPFREKINSGQAVRIMTGGILPEGTDTVIIQENVERHGDEITIDNQTRKGENVRQAGEDIRIGTTVLTSGTRLSPSDIGLLASLGIGKVSVFRKLRVAFFSTGDELRSIGEELEDGCVYDSNRYTLHGMLSRMDTDIYDMGVIRDKPEDIEEAFLHAADSADVVITSGGVSVGEADFVKETLQKVGAVNFWKVAMKPGRPLAFGTVKGAYFFGLPGNPVSVMVTFYQFVQSALRQLMGEKEINNLTFKVQCMSKLKKRPGRVEYQRGVLELDDTGQLVVKKTGAQGSGILSSMSSANCFIILPVENDGVEPGTVVDVQPFHGIV